ncbi:MAG: O-antigen ligase family protein [Phycisphaerales bacterium]|nr:O-antigen ligase family protein [Phycisphaerales bacterium]
MKAAGLLRWCGFVLLAAPAVLRTLLVIAVDPFFAIDSRVLPVPLEGLGPAGSVTLDLLALLGCLCALLAETLDGRSIDFKLLVLLLTPVPVLAWHGWSDAEQCRAGSQWFGAMSTAVGAMHLAREVRWRIVLLGAAVAITIPLAIKGLYQVTIEYHDTLSSFANNREALLESQGWEPGSSAAGIYLRRLTQREATGWLSLSNVYGSLMAMLAAFWVGAALAVARSKLQSGWLGVAILLAAAALAGLTASFSKGAAGAAAIGLILAAMCLLPRRWKQHVRPHAATVTFALLAAALVVTALRGMLFPEGLQQVDGYSLLFRWHYWSGAVRMFSAHPLAGVGPAGFQDAYLLVRPALSPEEVMSPHSVFIDWLAGIGIWAAAWIALVLILLARSAPSGATAPPAAEESAQPAPGADVQPAPRESWLKFAALCGLAVAVAAGVSAWVLNRRALLIDYHLLLMPLSLIGLGATVPLVALLVRSVSLGMLRWAVWAALTVVLLHSQIEMTLTQPGSAAIVMLLLGAAAARAPQGAPPRPALRSASFAAIVVFAALIVAHGALVAVPIGRIQNHLRTAHASLESIGRVRSTLDQAGRTRSADERIALLQEAEMQLQQQGIEIDLAGAWREIRSAIQLNDGQRVQRLLATGGAAISDALRRLEVESVTAALRELEAARPLRPLDAIAWRESSRLWMHLATLHEQRGDPAMRDEAAQVAIQLAEELANRRPLDANAAAMAARRWYEQQQFTGDAEMLARAIEWQKKVVRLDPNGLEAQRTFAQMLDEAGRGREALSAYERTLEINENMRLDPLKQLNPQQFDDVRGRIEALGGG